MAKEWDGWEPKDYLTPEEVRALLDQANLDHHLLLLRLMADAGLRISEACGAVADNLRKREDKGIVSWWIYIPESDAKFGKARWVILPEGTAALLKRVQEENENACWRDGIGAAGITPQAMGRALKRMAKRAELDVDRVHPHALRHSYAVEKIKQGMTLRTLQKMLGHAHLGTTQGYLRLAGVDMAEDDRQAPLRW